METRWYDSDWFVCLMACIGLAVMVMGNYFIHGGRIVW